MIFAWRTMNFDIIKKTWIYIQHNNIFVQISEMNFFKKYNINHDFESFQWHFLLIFMSVKLFI